MGVDIPNVAVMLYELKKEKKERKNNVKKKNRTRKLQL